MKAIELSGRWYVVKNVWTRKRLTPASQHPLRDGGSTFHYVKRRSYFEMFSNGNPLFTTDKSRAWGFPSLATVKMTFGEIRVVE